MKNRDTQSEKFCPYCGGVIDRYYSVATVSKIYDLSEDCIRKWIKEGKIKPIKIGRAVRIPKEELEKIILPYRDYNTNVNLVLSDLLD
ncbi:MAG TPA: hypothetical protein DHW42_00450 [Candidatus Marinimicrobia bacterium]|nr:hypothetical protein [Candidatus Neomarinimicrobiota bacterium]